jgi:hypothetical protein
MVRREKQFGLRILGTPITWWKLLMNGRKEKKGSVDRAWHKNLNISTTAHPFQLSKIGVGKMYSIRFIQSIWTLKSDWYWWRYNNSCDYHSNTISSHHPVCCNKCNKLAANRLFYSAISALQRYNQVDVIQVFDNQNITNIDEDTTILAIIMWIQFHHVTLFVVRIAITQQRLVQLTPPDRRHKIKIMEMRFEYSIVQIREISVEIWHFLWASLWSSFWNFPFHPHNLLVEGPKRFQSVQLHREKVLNILAMISVYYTSKLNQQFLRFGWLLIHHHDNKSTEMINFHPFGGP